MCIKRMHVWWLDCRLFPTPAYSLLSTVPILFAVISPDKQDRYCSVGEVNLHGVCNWRVDFARFGITKVHVRQRVVFISNVLTYFTINTTFPLI